MHPKENDILIVKGSIDFQKESSVVIIWFYFLNSFPYDYYKHPTIIMRKKYCLKKISIPLKNVK